MRQLWITGTLGAPWRADEQIWARLEDAYGERFNPALRDGIEKAMQRYFDQIGAPAFDEFADKLKTAQRLANQLEKVTNSFGEARILIGPHWEEYFPCEDHTWADEIPRGADDKVLFDWIVSQKPQYRGRRDHSNFYEVVSTIRATLDDLQREVISRKQTSTCKRLTWKQLIVDFDRVFRSAAKLVSSSHDCEGPYRSLSPFVSFVKEVQSFFPARSWRPASDVALSKAVSEVIGSVRKRRKTGEKCACRGFKKLPQNGRKRV